MRTTTKFVGDEFETAYARLLGGQVVGGLNDGGKDVMVPEIGAVQVKASLAGAMRFLSESLRRKQFIPVCVGEPGDPKKMISSLQQFGAWISEDIPDREQTLRGIAQVRARCAA